MSDKAFRAILNWSIAGAILYGIAMVTAGWALSDTCRVVDAAPTYAVGTTQSTTCDTAGNLNIVGSGTGTTAITIQGNTAHDSPDAGNPVGIGGFANSAPPALVQPGDRVRAWYSTRGAAITETVSFYPITAIPITASSANVANAIASATLTGAASVTTYISGFQCTSGGSTAGTAATVVVTGSISGNMTYVINSGTIAGQGNNLVVTYNPPIPASAVNTAIIVSMGALGDGNTHAACAAQGFRL